jgi:hypothetical protein
MNAVLPRCLILLLEFRFVACPRQATKRNFSIGWIGAASLLPRWRFDAGAIGDASFRTEARARTGSGGVSWSREEWAERPGEETLPRPVASGQSRAKPVS